MKYILLFGAAIIYILGSRFLAIHENISNNIQMSVDKSIQKINTQLGVSFLCCDISSTTPIWYEFSDSSGTQILQIESNGDIFLREKLIGHDKELGEVIRENWEKSLDRKN